MDKEKKYVLKKSVVYTGLIITGTAIIAGCAYRAINSGNNGDDVVLVPVTSTPKLSPTDSVKPTKAVTPTEGVKPTDSVKLTNAPTPTPNLILDVRSNAINEISNFIDDYGKENYSEENNALLEEIKNNAIVSISASESSEEIRDIVDKAKEEAGNVETLEETNEKIKNKELSSLKNESLNEIEHKYEDFKSGNNSEEELNKAKTLFEETNSKIKDGENIDSVKAIVNSFNNDLNSIIKERDNRIAKEEKDKQDKINEENRKKELENTRKKALEEVDKAYKSYAEKDYSKTNYSKLKSYYVEGSNNIKSCTDISKIDNYKNNTIKNMKSVKNNATLLKEKKDEATNELNKVYKKCTVSCKNTYDEYVNKIKKATKSGDIENILKEGKETLNKLEKELQTTKTKALKDLEKAFSSYKKSTYGDNYSLIVNIYDNAVNEINSCKITSDINEILTLRKQEMSKVSIPYTITELTKENINDEGAILAMSEILFERIMDITDTTYCSYQLDDKNVIFSNYDVAAWLCMFNLEYVKPETFKTIFKDCTYEQVFGYFNSFHVLRSIVVTSDEDSIDLRGTFVDKGLDEIYNGVLNIKIKDNITLTDEAMSYINTYINNYKNKEKNILVTKNFSKYLFNFRLSKETRLALNCSVDATFEMLDYILEDLCGKTPSNKFSQNGNKVYSKS